MSSEEQIKRGGLSDKMTNYAQEPPESLWLGVASKINKRGRQKQLIILLSAAAGIALALTIGVQFMVQNNLEQQGRENAVADKINPHSGNELTTEQNDGSTSDPQKNKITAAVQKNTSERNTAIQEKFVAKNNVKSSGLEGKVITELANILEEENIRQPALAENARPATIQLKDTPSDDSTAVPNSHGDNLKVNEDSLIKLLVPEEEQVDQSESKSRKGKWQIGASLSPLVNYRDVASSDKAQNIAVNNAESAKITYGGGVQLSYLQSERLRIESGVYYNKMGINIGDYSNFRSSIFSENLDYSPDSKTNAVSIANSMGTIVSSNSNVFINNYNNVAGLSDYNLLNPGELVVNNSTVKGFTQSFDFLEIPLNIKYLIIDKSLKLELIGGLSTNLMVNNSVSVVYDEGEIDFGEVQDLRSLNYSGNAGFGFIYDFTDNFCLSIEPRFRYYLNSINQDFLPVTRPYTFGLYTGINYTF